MKLVDPKKLSEITLAIIIMVFSAPLLADGCFNPFNPETDNTFVTPYGGADLACPSSVYKECIFTFKNGQVDSMTPEVCVDLGIGIVDVSNMDGVIWESSAGDPNSGIPAENKVDAILTDSAQGGKGCLYSFGTDQSMGAVGYQRNNGEFFPPTEVVFCSDQFEEVTAIAETIPEVKECVLLGGQSKTIHGVEFVCDNVLPGELRTIIIVKDTENCEEVPPGSNIYECDKVPDFGFRDTSNNIDFNNVCQCIGTPEGQTGSLPVLKVACDPDPEIEGECEVGAGAEVPAHITIQNGKCFTIGGKRKCF